METYKGRTIRTVAEQTLEGILYRYYVDSRRGCSYSTRARAIDAARKYVDRMEGTL